MSLELFCAWTTQFADEKESKRKMAAEFERLMNADTLRFRELSPGETPSASKRVGDGARPESRIQTLSLVLESLWLFYEAMRSGKPLASGDERLAQMRAALNNPPRRSDRSRDASFATEMGGISKRF
jgi:hypothetical protein